MDPKKALLPSHICFQDGKTVRPTERQPGDRVTVQFKKSVLAIALYRGTLLCGAIHLPLNPVYTPAEVSYFLIDATPRVFVCGPSKQNGLAAIANAADVKTVLMMNATGAGTLADAAKTAT